MGAEHSPSLGHPPMPRGALSWMARNPVAANLLMIFFLLGGLLFALKTKQEVFPEFTTDRISISVAYPGASPAEVEQGIVLSIEDAVRGLDGVKEVTSSSNEGSASISVELLTGVDKGRALQDVKNAVDRIVVFPELAERPIVSLTEARRQVLTIVVHGDQDEHVLRDLAERTREELLQRDGITLVELGAARPLEVSIEVPQHRLREYGLTLDRIASIIRATSLELPGGAVRTSGGEILLRTQERRDFASEYEDIPIATSPDGTIVRLGDVATIREDFQDSEQESFYNGQPAIQVQVYRVGDETPQSVSDEVYAYIDEVSAALPEGIGLAVWNDQSEIYRDRINLLLKNAAMGLVLVLVALGLFVEPKLAFWVTLGIPTSVLGSFLLLPVTGASLNMISLFAFIVTLGIVVDDAIVVGESIYEKRERGLGVARAAVEGVRDIAGPVVFAVLTNIASFMPLFFVPGGIGNAFRQIPSITVTVFVISLVESLFILPAHLAHRGKDTLFWRILGVPNHYFERFLGWVTREMYGRSLPVLLRWRYALIAICTTILLLSIGMVGGGHVPVGFLPRIDADVVTVSARLPFGVPIERTRSVQDRLLASLDRVIEEHGGRRIVRGVYTQIGSAIAAPGGPHGGPSLGGGGGHILGLQVALVPSDEREVGGREFSDAWREATGPIA
ncbi:MAG: efflux RND transporter permease subunit, partial [Planctomycetes bacterium]|nr:efflux RND transporter permease subunit [Planctomycetota bacterium]